MGTASHPRGGAGSRARPLIQAAGPLALALIGAPIRASEPAPSATSPDPAPSATSTDPAPSASPEPQGASPTKRPPPPRIRPDPASPAPSRPADAAALGLDRQDDGTYLHVDPYRRFTARIERDGTISFADRWRRPTRTGDRQHGALGGRPRGLFTPMGMSVTGPAEWAMALAGVDRDARVKAELLERTRELRTALAIAWHLDLLDRRLGELERDLDAILADPTLAPAARRALLFQRWDECDEAYRGPLPDLPEGAITAIDDARVAAAERARRIIEGFVARRLPPGHKDSFSPRELAALNARRVSRDPFAPYRPAAPARRTP